MPKVSVILPVYNCKDTLNDAINCIVNQTYKDWELVICDDCSKDGSYEIEMMYAREYPTKIKVLRNEENLMIAKTLNRCLEVAQGEYIARMDADDLCDPTRLEKQVDFLNSNPGLMVVGTAMRIFDQQGEKEIREATDKRNQFLSYSFSHPTILARKEMYDLLGGYSTDKSITRCEDVDLWFRFTAFGMKGGIINEPLYSHRESEIDYQKRTIKKGIDCSKVIYRGCKLIGTPKWRYIFLLQPIVSAAMPYWLMHTYHQIKDRRG